ncbi:MAG: OmpA family protein [Desulfovibrio sp.]|nr:OmpA family protein [Desulfovibrio sp.]
MSESRLARESRDDNYFIPMTDLLIGVLFIFIIIIMAIMLNIDELENSNKDEMEKNAGLTRRLERMSVINDELKQKIHELYAILTTKEARLIVLTEENETLRKVGLEEKEKYLQNILNLQNKINKFLAISNNIKKELLQKVQARMKQLGYPTTIDTENGILRLPDNVLFQSGEYVVTESGQKVLDVLTNVLEDVLPAYVWQRKGGALQCPREACLEAIYVEGHTDKKPVQGNLRGGIRSNLELSSARAIVTYQSFAKHERLNSFVNGRGEKLLGVCGYGESRPVKQGDSQEDLSANRRIDMRFLMEAPRLATESLVKDILK